MHGENLKVALELDTGEALSRACAQLSDLDPLPKAVAHRSAAEEIGLVAEAERALAIVVGASRRGAVGQILLGSVGASLLHGAPCAVAAAPLGYRERASGSPKHIAVAMDDSPESAAALSTAIALAQQAGGAITVLSVAETDFTYLPAPMLALPLSEMTDSERERADRTLDAAVKRIPAGISAASQRLEGSPRQVLSKASEDFDLMIVGSRGYGPVGQTFLGSVSAALIDGSRCPVLVLPRGETLEPHPTSKAGAAEISL
jgi:nucleotide-binding universal stress UspA family protein